MASLVPTTSVRKSRTGKCHVLHILKLVFAFNYNTYQLSGKGMFSMTTWMSHAKNLRMCRRAWGLSLAQRFFIDSSQDFITMNFLVKELTRALTSRFNLTKLKVHNELCSFPQSLLFKDTYLYTHLYILAWPGISPARSSTAFFNRFISIILSRTRAWSLVWVPYK